MLCNALSSSSDDVEVWGLETICEAGGFDGELGPDSISLMPEDRERDERFEALFNFIQYGLLQAALLKQTRRPDVSVLRHLFNRNNLIVSMSKLTWQRMKEADGGSSLAFSLDAWCTHLDLSGTWSWVPGRWLATKWPVRCVQVTMSDGTRTTQRAEHDEA